MLEFYRRMWVEGIPKARALWGAKSMLRTAVDANGKLLYSTRDWAAWVLSGAPDQVQLCDDESLLGGGRAGGQRASTCSERRRCPPCPDGGSPTTSSNLFARGLSAQKTEVAIGCWIMNRLLDCGRPESVAIAR